LLRDRYDVIVVGAGIGGLTAAAMLARRGVQVLLVEQHYMPGGCCAGIRRQGVTMDVGATVLYGFGEQGYNVHRFVMNELEEEIDMIPRQAIYNIHVEDYSIIFWRDFDPFFKQLLELFPGQEKELKNFYDFLFNLYRNTVLKSESVVPPTEMSPLDAMKSFMKNPPGMLKLSRMMTRSAADVFRQFFTDPEIIAFLDMLTRTFSYVDAHECPAILAVTMFVDNHVGGAYYPVGSPQMLSNKLEKAVERWGGRILYRHLVDEILISEGRACGVRLTDGTEIAATRVVSDASIWNLYGGLVKSRHIKPKRMKWAHDFIPTHANMMLYLGVDPKAFPEDTRPMEIIIEDPDNVEGHGITVYIPTLEDPGVSPPDLYSVTISVVSSASWPRPGEPAYQSEAYRRLKEEEAEKALLRVEKRFPDFRKHIKFMEIGTPSTVERYTLKNHGNVGGPKQMIGQEMMKRPKARSDWENLYLVGDSTVMGLGVLPSTVSGVGAANMALQDMGLEEYRPRSFARQYVNMVQGKPWTPPPDPAEPITPEAAARMARECDHCEDAGCMRSCPAGIDLVGFHRRMETGNIKGAVRSMREMNPLAEVCGHVCPSETFCQKNCNRLEYTDQPVRIAALHAWACGHVSRTEGWERFVPAQSGRRVAVVGAGPAGLTCAHFLARLGIRVDIMEKSDRPGGMLARALPPFRLSEEVVNRDIDGMRLPGMRFRFGQTLGREITVSGLAEDYDAVFLAPGLWSGRTMKKNGIKEAKTTDALRFLCTYRKNGKAAVPGRVLVIGGGSVAADAALAAKSSGAQKVSLACLEQKAEMPALPDEVREMKKQGVAVHCGWGLGEFLSPVKLGMVACTSVLDDQGRFRPVYDRSRTREMPFDLLIWAVGQEMEPALARHLKKEFGGKGLPGVNPETLEVDGRPGVYAGGDIVRGAGTVVQAVADGRKAAMAIHAGLNSRS
jgi:carotene isomerase